MEYNCYEGSISMKENVIYYMQDYELYRIEGEINPNLNK